MHYLNAEILSQSDGELVPKSSISYASKPGKYSSRCCIYLDFNESFFITCHLITPYCYFILLTYCLDLIFKNLLPSFSS